MRTIVVVRLLIGMTVPVVLVVLELLGVGFCFVEFLLSGVDSGWVVLRSFVQSASAEERSEVLAVAVVDGVLL